ncbi:MAG TPA: hypothetical protein VGZ25_15405 [Gemmataceae bacterium]|jgi:hypothetical protein|nr:hypothetical protein [Gemmataceae bacterium]
MNDHLEATHSDSASPNSHADSHLDESVEAKSTSLELRINRLEDAVAHLQDTQSLEARVVERVTERLQSHEATNARTVAGVIVDASRHLLPALGSNAPSDNAGTRGAPANRNSSLRRPWLLVEMLAEVRAIFRMFVDPRYHLGWRGRVAPILLVAVILTSSFWVPGTGLTIVGPLFDKCFNLILAYVLFKILSHEARKYRETAPDLPSSLRL